MIVRFLHGWGFDGSVWAQVVALLGEFDCRVDDRGYFGQPCAVEQGTIAVGHSFGAMRALAAPHDAKALVAINGFDRFAAAPDFPGVPARVIARMRDRFEGEPDAVLADFRHRLGAPPAPPLRDGAALRHDLAMLASDDGRGRCAVPVLALHAADDPLLPAALQDAAFAAAGAVERVTLASGGHLLPLTAPEACAAAIRRAAETVR